MKPTLLILSVLMVAHQIDAQSTRKMIPAKPQPARNVSAPDVREIGGTNYHVHVRSNGQPLLGWENLHARVIRKTKEGVLLEKAREIVHTGGYERRDRLNKVGVFTGGADPVIYTWTEYVFTGDCALILLVRYPNDRELITGQKITVLAKRDGIYDLKSGDSIARYDYGKSVKTAK